MKKTKEVIIDFRKAKKDHVPICIKNENVDIVKSYKYPGTLICNNLQSCENIQNIVKKANKRMYFVRKLRKIGVNVNILSNFYKSTVESILLFCIVCWYGNSKHHDRKILKKIVKTAKRLGCRVKNIDEMYKLAVRGKCEKILKDKSHPLHRYYKFLPSGCRLDSIYARTSRFQNSFVLDSIRLFNSM